jgi:hypothetical protein
MNVCTKEGSITLMLMLLLAIVMVYCMSVWRTALYIQDFATQRAIYTQQTYFTRSMLQSACLWLGDNAMTIRNFLQQQKGSLVLSGNLPAGGAFVGCTAEVIVTLSDEHHCTVVACFKRGNHAPIEYTTRVAV